MAPLFFCPEEVAASARRAALLYEWEMLGLVIRVIATPALLAAAVAIVSTTGLGLGESWFDEQRMLLTPALVAAAFLGLKEAWRAEIRLSAAAVFALVAGLGMASATASARPSAALAEWAVLVAILSVAGSGCYMRADSIKDQAALSAGLIASCYSVGVVANIVSAFLVGLPIGRETFMVGFSNPRFPAQLQALTLPLMPIALELVRRPSARAALSLVLALWWMCLIGSGSRTAWLALFMAALVLVLIGASGRRWFVIQARYAALGAMLYLLIFYVAAPLLGTPADLETGRLAYTASIDARLELARIALSLIAAHPLLGVGPMHFAYVDNGLGAHPHNFWLQLGGEWGLPVLAVTGCLAVGLTWRMLQIARSAADDSEQGLVSVSLLAALVVWLVGTQFDGYMVVPTSQVASAIVLMLCVARVSRNSQTCLSSTRPRLAGRAIRVAILLVGLSAAAALVRLPLTPFGKPTVREALWRAENPTAAFWPRFWQQGWIGPDADPTAR